MTSRNPARRRPAGVTDHAATVTPPRPCGITATDPKGTMMRTRQEVEERRADAMLRLSKAKTHADMGARSAEVDALSWVLNIPTWDEEAGDE